MKTVTSKTMGDECLRGETGAVRWCKGLGGAKKEFNRIGAA
jgi:hypothetical protein